MRNDLKISFKNFDKLQFYHYFIKWKNRAECDKINKTKETKNEMSQIYFNNQTKLIFELESEKDKQYE